MICPSCNGSGISPLPHVPGHAGGWLDEQYIHSGIECGACGGSGRIPDESPSGEGPAAIPPQAMLAGKVVVYDAGTCMASILLEFGEVRAGDRLWMHDTAARPFSVKAAGMEGAFGPVTSAAMGSTIRIFLPHNVFESALVWYEKGERE